MDLHTIIVTNRNKEIHDGKLWFGDQLNQNAQDQTNVLTFVRTSLEPIEGKPHKLSKRYGPLAEISPDTFEAYLADIVACENGGTGNGMPWIFFLNGNNQTLKKNLKKSARIQRRYGVNMIIFSWPSRSYNPGPSLQLLTALGLSTISKTLAAKVAVKIYKKKKRQYVEARRIAELSAADVRAAIQLFGSNLLTPLPGEIKKSLLIHSLGNYVLENLVRNSPRGWTDFTFDNLIMHQADVDPVNHKSWVEQIDICEPANTVVTHNTGDGVLFLSSIINSKLLGRPLSGRCRLGNQPKLQQTARNVVYEDFSAWQGVDMEHGLAWSKWVGKDIKKYFRSLFF